MPSIALYGHLTLDSTPLPQAYGEYCYTCAVRRAMRAIRTGSPSTRIHAYIFTHPWKKWGFADQFCSQNRVQVGGVDACPLTAAATHASELPMVIAPSYGYRVHLNTCLNPCLIRGM